MKTLHNTKNCNYRRFLHKRVKDGKISGQFYRFLCRNFPYRLTYHAIGMNVRKVMHGKTSPVHHRGDGVFRGLSQPFEATRYHSLVVAKDSLPECLEVTAWTQTESGEVDEIMGLRHRELAIEGVQFHPESILTAHGHDLLRNFLEQ